MKITIAMATYSKTSKVRLTSLSELRPPDPSKFREGHTIQAHGQALMVDEYQGARPAPYYGVLRPLGRSLQILSHSEMSMRSRTRQFLLPLVTSAFWRIIQNHEEPQIKCQIIVRGNYHSHGNIQQNVKSEVNYSNGSFPLSHNYPPFHPPTR